MNNFEVYHAGNSSGFTVFYIFVFWQILLQTNDRDKRTGRPLRRTIAGVASIFNIISHL